MTDKTMTSEELLKFNGQDGQPAYVAIGSNIYDVSASPLWQGGIHGEIHQAGRDLSIELKSAPHVAAVIHRFPRVAQLTEAPRQQSTLAAKLIIAAAAVLALILAVTWLR